MISDAFIPNDLLGSVSDIVHPPDPCHLIPAFQFFRYAFGNSHLFYEGIHKAKDLYCREHGMELYMKFPMYEKETKYCNKLQKQQIAA